MGSNCGISQSLLSFYFTLCAPLMFSFPIRCLERDAEVELSVPNHCFHMLNSYFLPPCTL